MSLRAFMLAADALRLEEGVGFHVETVGAQPARVPSPSDNKARNAQAMQQIQAMLGGVQKKKGKR